MLDSKTELEKDSFVLFLNTKFLISPASTLDVDKAGEYVVFNRAWEYIQKVDPDNLVAQEALLRFADIHLKLALELSINYFQEHEEYEKCSHLKKNLEFVKLLLT